MNLQKQAKELDKFLQSRKIFLSVIINPTNAFSTIFKRFIKVHYQIIINKNK